MAKTIKTRRTKTNLPRSLARLYPNVKVVVDASEPIQIEVNKKDCDEAKAKDPTNCALARAVKRSYKADAAIIGISSSYVITGDKAIRFDTPASVQREIVTFDRHHSFEPGEYNLNPKAPTARLGSYHHRDHGKGGTKNGKKARRVHLTKLIRVLPKGHQGV